MTSTAPSAARLFQLAQVQSRIFGNTLNPTNARLGNKILRQRLTGEIRAQYYPPRYPGIRELKKLMPEYVFIDEDEETRVEDVEYRKERGKGAPKKAKGKKDARTQRKK